MMRYGQMRKYFRKSSNNIPRILTETRETPFWDQFKEEPNKILCKLRY